MNEIIKEVFGAVVNEQPYAFPSGTPLYISAGYRGSILTWGDHKCLLVKPVNTELSLPSIKKQVRKIESICSLPVIIDLEKMTSRQRTNLIESGIAFVSDSGQLFIPFWGCYFEEKIRNSEFMHEKMTGNAQLVYLYLYYLNLNDPIEIKLAQICQRLGLPKATCSRAVQVLNSFGLIDIRNEGTAKLIALKQPLISTMGKAEAYLVSPVHKTIYLKDFSGVYNYKIGGIRALADKSMLAARESDGSYVISREEFRKIPAADLIDRQECRDFGGIILEVWKYDPFLLSDSYYVDDISLVLSLRDDIDERVQKELDTIRNNYGMQVE